MIEREEGKLLLAAASALVTTVMLKRQHALVDMLPSLANRIVVEASPLSFRHTFNLIDILQ
jgi:hypothetical protein